VEVLEVIKLLTAVESYLEFSVKCETQGPSLTLIKIDRPTGAVICAHIPFLPLRIVSKRHDLPTHFFPVD